MNQHTYPEGATPLDENEIAGLIPTHLTARSQLDRWEYENIAEALSWLYRRKPKNILNEYFAKTLHRKMFENVWRWAGRFRKSDIRSGYISALRSADKGCFEQLRQFVRS